MKYVVWIIDGGSMEDPQFHSELALEVEANTEGEAINEWIEQKDLHAEIDETKEGILYYCGRKVRCKPSEDVTLRLEVLE